MTRPLLVLPDAADTPTGSDPLVAGPAFLETRAAASSELFLLDPGRDADPWRSLRRIRQHGNPGVYLRPVLVPHDADAALRAATDGVWRPGNVEGIRHDPVEEINRRVQPYLEAGPDQALGLRLLRFMTTRGEEFEPQATTATPQGFIYPRLEPLATNEGEGVLNTLEVLAEQSLLTGRLVTRVHSCVHCGCSFLNFLEVCPHCQSLDITSEDLVHHFRCGFTAELAEFEQAEGMICPKCRRALANIGVDYDKPSVIYHCRNCAHDFQEPVVHSSCFACGRGAAPEDQLSRDIQAYWITALGQNAATLGFEGLFLNVVSGRLSLWSWESFAQIVEVEGARIERYAVSHSSVLMVQMRGIEGVYARFGKRSREVFEEVANLFTAILRRCDVVTARSETVFVTLLPETEESGARRVAERLESGLHELVTHNLGVDLEFASEAHAVDAGLDVAALVEGFLSRHAD